MLNAGRAAMIGKGADQGGYWGLCFTAEQAGSTIKLAKNHVDAPNVDVVISYDGKTWQPYYINQSVAEDAQIVTLQNVGDKVYFAAGDSGNKRFSSSSRRNYFTMSGLIAASGSIMSLLDRNVNETSLANTEGYTFGYMFRNCTSLTTAPELPATTLAIYCYQRMFEGCSSLQVAPELPATTLVQSCYQYMFNNCSNLQVAPELPSYGFARSCYQYMFQNCTSLETAPTIHGSGMNMYSCTGTFSGCTSLKTAKVIIPSIPNSSSCLANAFWQCTNLQELEVGFDAWNTENQTTTTNWVQDVNGQGVFKCPRALPIIKDANHIPVNFTVEYTD